MLDPFDISIVESTSSVKGCEDRRSDATTVADYQIAHHHYGPSASATWANCPGAIQAQEGIPNEDSVYADEGSAAHELAAKVLLDPDSVCEDFMGEMIYVTTDGTEYFVDEQMCYYVQFYYVDVIRELVKKKKGTLYVETKISYDDVVPGAFGTSDAIIVCPNGTVYVVDLKYGQGVMVDAENNTQAALYAIGARQAYCPRGFGVKRFKIMIIQPRLDHVSEWTVSNRELTEISDKLHQAYLASLDPNAKRIPGAKQCRWCKAKGNCREYANYVNKDIFVGFDTEEVLVDQVNNLQLVNPNILSNDELGDLLKICPMLSDWIKAIGEHAIKELRAGNAVKDHKLVAGRGKRETKDADKFYKALSSKVGIDQAAPRKLLSIPQAEKLFDKKTGKPLKGSRFLKNHTKFIDGQSTIAPIDDPRKEIIVDLNDGFDNDPFQI